MFIQNTPSGPITNISTFDAMDHARLDSLERTLREVVEALEPGKDEHGFDQHLYYSERLEIVEGIRNGETFGPNWIDWMHRTARDTLRLQNK